MHIAIEKTQGQLVREIHAGICSVLDTSCDAPLINCRVFFLGPGPDCNRLGCNKTVMVNSKSDFRRQLEEVRRFRNNRKIER